MSKGETFLQYCTRESGFGRTSWEAAILIHIFGVASLTMGITESPWAFLGLVAPVTLWIGTWMNYRGKWK